MKVLMISNDPKILEKGSAVYARHIEYAKKFDEFHAVYVTGSSILKSPFKAIKDGKRIMVARGFGTDDLITVQDPFFTAFVGIRLKKIFGSKLEIQIHTDIGSPYYGSQNFLNKIRIFLAKRHLPKADRIRVVSDRIKKFLVEDPRFRIEDSKIEIRPIAVDEERIKTAQVTVDLHKKYPQFKKIILMASRLTKEKDIPTALLAFKKVSLVIPSVGLVIVGEGPEKEELRVKSQELRIGDKVVFEPWLNELQSYYKTCDIFLSSSLYEGYGMSMLEAHIAGVPVVATDTGIAKEITPYVCPVGDSICLAEKIIKILS